MTFFRKNKFSALLLLSLIAGCGPNRAVLRQYMAGSPHRVIVILPFDRVHGQKNFSQQAADLMTGKLQQIGFVVIDRNKTLSAFKILKMTDHTYDNSDAVAMLGQQLGAQAVLVGAIDDCYERVNHRAPVYEFITVPPPACCSSAMPCASTMVYDPVLQAYVNSCSTTHRRMTIEPGENNRDAGFSARVRFIDTTTKSVLWESTEQSTGVDPTAAGAADDVTDALTNRLMEDMMKSHF